jgi:hypothetical protein
MSSTAWAYRLGAVLDVVLVVADRLDPHPHEQLVLAVRSAGVADVERLGPRRRVAAQHRHPVLSGGAGISDRSTLTSGMAVASMTATWR